MRAPCIIKRTTDRHDGLTVEYLETSVPKAKYTGDKNRARVYVYTGYAEYIVRTQLRNGARPSQSFTVVTLKEDKRK